VSPRVRAASTALGGLAQDGGDVGGALLDAAWAEFGDRPASADHGGAAFPDANQPGEKLLMVYSLLMVYPLLNGTLA
jgi:hypothetical protein